MTIIMIFVLRYLLLRSETMSSPYEYIATEDSLKRNSEPHAEKKKVPKMFVAC